MDLVLHTQLSLFPSWWCLCKLVSQSSKSLCLGQVPRLLPPAPPASHPWVKSETEQLLPSGMGHPPRAVLPKAGASASASPQAALWVIGPLRGKGSCWQQVCWSFDSIAGIATCESTGLIPCARYRVALRYGWLKVSPMGANLPTHHIQENYLSVPDELEIFKKLLFQVGLEKLEPCNHRQSLSSTIRNWVHTTLRHFARQIAYVVP